MLSHLRLAVFLCTVPVTLADFIGLPTYPPPRDFTTNNSIVPAAWLNLSSILDAHFQQNFTAINATTALAGLSNVTFSLGIFSLHDPDAAAFQYHHGSSQLAANENGAKNVDADSIYRIASVSKLITVFTGLLSLSEEDWNTPLTEFFPSLRNATSVTELQDAPSWQDITPWALASHMSGIGATGPIADLLATFVTIALAQNTTAEDLEPAVQAIAALAGLPPVPLDVFGACSVVDCNSTAAFIDSIASSPPVFEPWTTPGYSNLGMFILGQVISNVTGKGYKDYTSLYSDTLFSPLNMSSTYLNAPSPDGTAANRSVIVGPLSGTWDFPIDSPTIPSGGVLSTLNDLNKLGVALLNHTLLSPVATRKWMKPVSHTASLTYSVGAPWEVVRYMSPTSGRVTDIYTKLGDSGSYSAMLAIIPDYNAGFTYLNAHYAEPGTNSEALRATVALGTINELVEVLMPALEAQAAAEAERNFVGTFVSDNDSVNSSIIISQRKEANMTSGIGACLIIEQWISNSTDALLTFAGQVPRLLPAIVGEGPAPQQITFQVSTDPQWSSYTAAGLGPFSGIYGSNIGWFTFDGDSYGGRYAGRGIGTFVFELDARGRAVAVTNAAAGLRMLRE
ncbi:Putative beta-lactamase/transpeptidase [Septoria linicola]|uniref:Beta-lactamase/transpeptidase n=1 Tax=Septoria linicola TaxID=215465 RepID=A0A9Q9ENS3_9PEZI|nr:putative beta-lactamase/transpeptidase [Septoria linicola]USW55758.1 Putative beta-lactamase/transpeptidase [Septoria linicola]